MNPTKRGYTIAQTVGYSGRPRTAVYEAIRTGALRSYKVGASRLLLLEDIDAWLDSITTGADRG